jgi:pilus assembly protein Flp/PilA
MRYIKQLFNVASLLQMMYFPTLSLPTAKVSMPRAKGQGLVEYALILVLVAVVVIAVLTLLGPAIGDVFSTINTELGDVNNPAD